MSKKAAFFGLFLLVVCAALLFRTVRLDLRPMHHDEANQAVKFGDLLEKGTYRYDPNEHHGPSLYYLSLPFAWISSGTSFASLDEKTLRMVPAIFGVGVVLLLLLLRGGYSSSTIFFSGILAAVSPVMVYYNRFYIQETLLVFFLVGAIATSWRYHQDRTWGWAAATGFFCGMVYATKETSLIVFGSLIASLLLARIFEKRNGRKGFILSHFLAFLGTALVSSFLLFSSFFQNPRGILDSVVAFRTYFERAAEAGFHSYPWSYYLKMLAFSRYGDGPIWSEALILVLALVGCIAAFRPGSDKDSHPLFMRFVCFYAIVSTAIYSLIPYKTPWNMLPFYIGIVLLAGNGTAFLLESSKKLIIQSLIVVILGVGFYHLGMQSFRANFEYHADPRNPYVYAQTSMDFLNLVHRIDDLAQYHPDRREMLIKVITYADEAWPLPWYLRGFSRVGYWEEAEEAGDMSEAPLIISSVDKTEKLWSRLKETHQAEFYGLRPEVLLILHIKKDLWDEFLEKKPVK
ncbi:MAG: TIGR03663 family protein [Candidatus Aminicenantes bacterium]|nr:TIGR03663 family protein [Candidatus Aminicenantes bacterium]MDH5384081.1 TIGR03663 family protein [Candidatus Aminicenantes bacterium]MDH5742091.1 TIGR03663 family protein [Candidatus Aminicenantes bacterium]